MDNELKKEYIAYLKSKKILLISLTVAIFIVFAFILILLNLPNKTEDEEPLSEINEVLIHNIIIDNMDEDGLGLLYNEKYYRLQYGIHIKDESYVGNKLGTTSSSNKLQLVDENKNTYSYSEGASYAVEGGTSYYAYNGPEDVILLKANDPTINGYWVLSPENLAKASIFPLLENIDNCTVNFYPDLERPDFFYPMETPADFLKSISRIDDINNSYIISNYITIDDGSGLLYGLVSCLNTDDGCVYLESPQYRNLKFIADDYISSYMVEYYTSEQENSDSSEPDINIDDYTEEEIKQIYEEYYLRYLEMIEEENNS